jgi:UDP-glucose 4-epimerase
VIAFDNLEFGDAKNLAWAGGNAALDFVEGDVRDKEALRKAMRGCDWVFHHAAAASVPDSVARPEETNAANLTAVLQMLVLARECGVRRFIFASSSAVYGDDPTEVKREDLGPRPISPYGLQKYAAERYAQLFYQLHGLETVSLRYFNVFGPRQGFDSPYSGVIARFCTRMLAGEAPIVFGDGLQCRDFVYIENVVQANLLAAERPAAQAAGQVFNIASGRSSTLLELAAALNGLTGQKLEPEFRPARSGDVRFSRADISLARERLGYDPKVSFEEGLARTLAFYREAPAE